jgi:hypothetical protein
MKSLLFAFAASLFFCSTLYSQDERLDELPFEEEDIVDDGARPYGAVAGGFVANFTFVDFDDLNSKLGDLGFGEFSGPLITIGGQGFTVLPWIPNVRIGVMGVSGSALTDEITDDNTGISSQAEYTVGYTGLAIDYGYVLTDGLALLGGVTIGYGNQEFAIYNARTIDWDGVTTAAPQTNEGIQKFDQDMIMLQPQVNIEWAFTNLFMFRAGASYNLNFGTADDWNYNNIGTVENMPEISPNGFNLHAGLFIGLFNY